MLNGLKVVEYATYIAAPAAGCILSDWGADVVKVEPPQGDPMRRFFDSIGADATDNPVFDLDNRGKRSIALDTSSPEGVEVLKRLAKEADVFLTNVRPGGLARAGLDWESLKELNPRLVYASITGYGLEGDEMDRAGFDIAAFWSRSGVARLTAIKGQEPMPIRTGMGDHITGMATATGILAALFDRNQTGKGRLVETSLLRTGVYSVASDMAIQLKFGRLASNRPRHQAVNPLGNFFEAACGTWICIVPRQGNTDWPNFARAIERPDLLKDERFSTSRLRREHKSELVDELDMAFKTRTLEEWGPRLDAEDVVWAPVQTAAQVVADPQVSATGAFTEIPGGTMEGEPYKTISTPVRFHETQTGPQGPSPKTGEHGDNVLSELGYSSSQIEELREKGVIVGPPHQD